MRPLILGALAKRLLTYLPTTSECFCRIGKNLSGHSGRGCSLDFIPMFFTELLPTILPTYHRFSAILKDSHILLYA